MYFKWTKEKCQEEALKYNCRIDFKKSNASAHEAARRNCWLEDITTHMFKPYGMKIKWTKEKCQEEALKYNYRSEFKNKCVSAYNASLKNKWLDEICSHMIVSGNKFKRCVYVYEFSDNYAYIGLTYNISNRNYRHFKNYKKNSSKVFKHIYETNLIPKLIQLTEYILAQDASILEGEYVNKYISNGWKILNIAKAGGTGGNMIKWSKEKCQEESLKYNDIKDFFNKSNLAYTKALKSKWLDEICSHMIINKMYNSNRTKENCQEEALKYNSRFEFSKKSIAIYVFSNRHKWLDEICSHMIKTANPKNYWTKEKCFEVALKCKNKKQFQKKYSSAYNRCYKNGWLNEFFKNK